MIIRFQNIIVFIIAIIAFYSCAIDRNVEKKAIKDIYGCPITFSLKSKKVIYFSQNGERIRTSFGGVEFNGGSDSLSTYLLSKYVDHPEYNYEEYNVYEYFVVFLDKNLDVKEVRIMNRKLTDKDTYHYSHIFIDALKNTSGKWHKIIKNQEWYIYLHRQKIY